MFKVGDKVKLHVVKDIDDCNLHEIWDGETGIIVPQVKHKVQRDYRVQPDKEEHGILNMWEQELELIESVEKQTLEAQNSDKIRTFQSGATRDTDLNKLDYEGFLSPLVLERYAQYLNKHRIQSDGQLRDSDNWQKMFGKNHFDVCLKSAFRHFMDIWLYHRGRKTINIEDSLCAALFNIQSYLFKVLKDKENEQKTT